MLKFTYLTICWCLYIDRFSKIIGYIIKSTLNHFEEYTYRLDCTISLDHCYISGYDPCTIKQCNLFDCRYCSYDYIRQNYHNEILIYYNKLCELIQLQDQDTLSHRTTIQCKHKVGSVMEFFQISLRLYIQ